MTKEKVFGLGVVLTVLICVASGCPQSQPGGSQQETPASELILGKWRIYVRYAGAADTNTAILNFYANGTFDNSTLDGRAIPGTWVARADGTVVADIDDSWYIPDGLVVQRCTMEIQVSEGELTGTCWYQACLDFDCEEANGMLEGVRIGKVENLLDDTKGFVGNPIMSMGESIVRRHWLFVP